MKGSHLRCSAHRTPDIGSLVNSAGRKLRTVCVCGHSTWTTLSTSSERVLPMVTIEPSGRLCLGLGGGFVEAHRAQSAARYCLRCGYARRKIRDRERSSRPHEAATA